MIKIAIVGFGFAGRERLAAINKLRAKGYDCQCIGTYDPYLTGSEFTSLNAVLSANPDWVLICVPHHQMLITAKPFLKAGCRVLLEKPFGRSVTEAQQLIALQLYPQQLAVGFNYRFYEGIQALYRDWQNHVFGKIIAISMTLGHGGRPDDQQSWKLTAEACGGGSLLDPGIHLFDLMQCFSQGPITYVGGATWHGFWQTGIEEEAQLILKNQQTIINMNTSLVRWRNTFKIEIHGTEHYGIVTGRGRHYGEQNYVKGPRWGWLNHVDQSAAERHYPMRDTENSFALVLEELIYHPQQTALPPCSATEGLAAMQLWEKCQEALIMKPIEHTCPPTA